MSQHRGYSIFLWPTTKNFLFDVAKIISWAINQPCEISSQINPNWTNIIIGANAILYQKITEPLPEDTIIVNLEQLYEGSMWLTQDYINLLKTYIVWDYTQHNVNWLQEHLSVKAHLFSLGFTPTLKYSTLNPNPETIDVLFYGGETERRSHIYSELINKGVKVVFRYNDLWNDERDQLMRSAKIILNIHYHPSALFESTRVYHALINEKFVISERAVNQDEYQHLNHGLVICDYDAIVETVLEYLAKDPDRQEIAHRGYQLIGNLPPKLPDYLTIPHIYIINLKHRTDRRDRMIQRMKYHGLHHHFSFIEAVNAHDRMIDNYYGKGFDLTGQIDNSVRSPYRPMFACLASHLKTLRKMIHDRRQEAIILEDDAMLRNDFVNQFPFIRENLPHDANVMLLYYYGLSKYQWIGKNPNRHNLLAFHDDNWGAVGYWIRREYAGECLEKYDRPFSEIVPSHLLTSELITMTPNSYLAYPLLVIEEPLVNSDLRGSSKLHEDYSIKFGWDNYIEAESESWKALLTAKILDQPHDICKVLNKIQLSKLSSFHQFLYLDLATITYWYADQKPTAQRLAYKLQELAIKDPIIQKEVIKHYDRMASNLLFHYNPSYYCGQIVIMSELDGVWDPSSINLSESAEAILTQELVNRGYRVVIYSHPPPKSVYSLPLSNPLYRQIESLDRDREVYDVAIIRGPTNNYNLAKKTLIWLQDQSPNLIIESVEMEKVWDNSQTK